jgi:protein-S-isoprenylcysteine O-methyltransferase Ste14
MRNFVTRLRVWFPPPLILLLFFVTDVLTAIPRFTFDIVNIVLSVLLTGVCITMILHTAWQMSTNGTTLNPLHPDRTTKLVTVGCYAWSRNPIYLGMSGLQLSVALCFGSLVGILAVPLFMFVVARLHIHVEEVHFENVSGWNGNAIPNGFVAGYSNPVVLQETNKGSV